MSDGLLKNFEVVTDEWQDWWHSMRKDHLPRFRHSTLKWTGEHRKRNVIHLLVNVVTETIRALPRTLTYGLMMWGGLEVILWVPLW